MIIGYDFWADGVFYDKETSPVIKIDNDGVAFDNCNTINHLDTFELRNGSFDEIHITKDSSEIDNNVAKTKWGINTVLLAKFTNDLIGGNIGLSVGDTTYDIAYVEIRRRKKGEDIWQTFFTIDYAPDINLYSIIDKFIESEEYYEYCLRPIALDGAGNKIIGNNTLPKDVFINYEYMSIFDNTASYNLIYNVEFGDMSHQIGANSVETFSSKYPYIVYGESNYVEGSINCLLVSEESTIGDVDVYNEKILRNNIIDFLTNKKCKILKKPDGTYMIIKIVGTPTLIPNNNLLGIYDISFDFVQVGDANNAEELAEFTFNFDYLTHQYIDDDDIIVKTITKNIG